jgi:hypothetical protein
MSDKPVAERLQVKGDRRLSMVNAPAEVDRHIGAERAPTKSADVVLAFVRDETGLAAWFQKIVPILKADAIPWLAYPKLTSPLAGELNRDVIYELVRKRGWDTVSAIAIDDDWSALRVKKVATPLAPRPAKGAKPPNSRRK